jgi:hypothetical protein
MVSKKYSYHYDLDLIFFWAAQNAVTYLSSRVFSPKAWRPGYLVLLLGRFFSIAGTTELSVRNKCNQKVY